MATQKASLIVEALSSASAVQLMAAVVGMAAIGLYAPAIAQAAVAFGEIGTNIADNSKGVAKGVTFAGYAGGIIMGFLGLTDMYKASKRQSDSSYGVGLAKILVGGLALGFGETMGSGSASLFGSDQTSGLNELGIK